MKNIFPILKLNDKYTLVERKRDGGTFIEYIICNGLKPVENGEPNEYEWISGMYSFSLEGAIKTAALRCYEPICRYVVIEMDSDGNVKEETFDEYGKAHKEMEERFMKYKDDPDCTLSEYSAGLFEEEAAVNFGEDWIVWKLIEIRV